MSQSISTFDFQNLNSVEKLELIGQLWDSLPEVSSALPMPEWHRQELDDRLANADANPQAAIPWNEVEQRLRKQQ